MFVFLFVCVCMYVEIRFHISITFGRLPVSMVAGAISVSSISRFSLAARVLVGVELFLFFRAGDGVPYKNHINARSKCH